MSLASHNIFVTRYHWLCVGIKSEPGENQDWFCTRCVAKKQVNIEEVLLIMEWIVMKYAFREFTWIVVDHPRKRSSVQVVSL